MQLNENYRLHPLLVWAYRGQSTAESGGILAYLVPSARRLNKMSDCISLQCVVDLVAPCLLFHGLLVTW
jgi:hypothetical protein